MTTTPTSIWDRALSDAGADRDLTPEEIDLFEYMVGQRIARVPDQYTIRGRFGDPDREAEPDEVPGLVATYFAHYYRVWAKGTPGIFKAAKIESLDPASQHREQLDRFAMGEGQTLFLAGPIGTGKSYAAWAIAHVVKAVRPRAVVRAWSVPRLLLDMRPDHDENAFERACTADLLVLDDLAAAKPTDWAAEQLYSIAEARSSNSLRTIITTNAKFDDLCQMWGDPMMDRWRHRSITAVFKGESRRKPLW